MALFTPRIRLETSEREGLRAACHQQGIEERHLAVGSGASGSGPAWAVALPTHLAYGRSQEWTFVAWHVIDHGRWNPETKVLEIDEQGAIVDDADGAGIVGRGGRRHRCGLDRPGRVPEVMSERVSATIVFHRAFAMPGRSTQLTVVARRNLATQDVRWLASLGRGMRADDEDVQAFALAAIRRLRTEYGS